jgi:hypothetical protein
MLGDLNCIPLGFLHAVGVGFVYLKSVRSKAFSGRKRRLHLRACQESTPRRPAVEPQVGGGACYAECMCFILYRQEV